MKSIYLTSIIFVAILSCTSNHIETHKYDYNVQELFDREEISCLDIIVSFFDSFIINYTNELDVNKAYHEYFKILKTTESLDDLKTYIGLSDSNDTKALIKILKDRNIFNEIWKHSYGYNYESSDTSYTQLSLNMQGKYYKLLELKGNRDAFIKKYTIFVQSSGDISPSLIAYVMKDYNNIDFQKPDNRLILAVHYITILSKESGIK